MGVQLDLQAIDKLKLDDDEDIIRLGNMVNDVYVGSQPYLTNLAYKWEENIRFFLGEHYIQYDNTYRKFDVIPRTKYNDYLPRPITNYILSIVQTLVSIYTRRRPTIKVRSNSTDPDDRSSAKLSDRVIDAKWEDDDETRNSIMSALILCLCGTVIRKDYWNSTIGPRLQIEEDEEDLDIPLGDNGVEIIDPFRFIPDVYAQNYYLEANVRSLPWIQENYGKKGDGFTGMADEVKPETTVNYMMQLSNRLKTTSGIGGGFRSGDESFQMENSAVVIEAYIKPTKNHPNGLMVVYAGGVVLYAAPVPYFDAKKKESWHPYSFCKYQEVNFRWHGISLVENLLSMQRRINSIDALIILNRQTMAIPQWLVPSGSGVPEGYINGQPGLQIPYNPAAANGARPEKIGGTGLPADIYKERQELVQALHVISGVNEVLAGTRPEGVNTATGMQMLLEQSYSKFNPFISNWERYMEHGQIKKLNIIRKFYQEPREDFINRLKEINKDNLDVQIAAFVGNDLKDNVDIRIEAGSSLPKSEVVEQSNYKELAQFGLFGPLDPNQNPIGNEKFLEKFGITLPHSELDADIKRALFVNKVLTAINREEMPIEDYPPILEIDNLEIHMKVLTDRMKSPEFKDERGVFQHRYIEIKKIIDRREQVKRAQERAARAQQEQQMMQGLQAQSGMAQPNFSQGLGQPDLPATNQQLQNSITPDMLAQIQAQGIPQQGL